jgi:hypothetical protein
MATLSFKISQRTKRRLDLFRLNIFERRAQIKNVPSPADIEADEKDAGHTDDHDVWFESTFLTNVNISKVLSIPRGTLD